MITIKFLPDDLGDVKRNSLLNQIVYQIFKLLRLNGFNPIQADGQKCRTIELTDIQDKIPELFILLQELQLGSMHVSGTVVTCNFDEQNWRLTRNRTIIFIPSYPGKDLSFKSLYCIQELCELDSQMIDYFYKYKEIGDKFEYTVTLLPGVSDQELVNMIANSGFTVSISIQTDFIQVTI